MIEVANINSKTITQMPIRMSCRSHDGHITEFPRQIQHKNAIPSSVHPPYIRAVPDARVAAIPLILRPKKPAVVGAP